MKNIIKTKDQIIYIDTKEIAAIKAIKLEFYFLVHVYLKNNSQYLEFKVDFSEIDEVLQKLNS